MITSSIAVLAVVDIPASVAFYVNVLGFKQQWLWGNPPTFGCVSLGKAEIFLCQQPQLAHQVEGHMHCFFDEENVDALHEQHRAAGAPIVSPIENKPWGVREYTVRDPSGYHLRFGGPITYTRPATATDSLSPHVRFDVAKPDVETYRALFRSVEWHCHEAMQEVLERSDFCVLATDRRDGAAVGITRVTGDGNCYMIWDVIVRPSHQGQKIGSTMMQRATEEIRRRAPHAGFVGLFTGKPAFYERAGFKKCSGMSFTP
jgi:catechol 2,3-dioxygenase-like lactoylglutathione lyase family enzyme/GNAT superfamily N-acetyltransferase